MNPQKVLFFSFSTRFGGSERDTLRRAQFLSENAREVTYVSNNQDVYFELQQVPTIKAIFYETENKKLFKKEIKELINKTKYQFIHTCTVSFYFFTICMALKNRMKSSFFFGGSSVSKVNLKRVIALNLVDRVIVNSSEAQRNIQKYIIFNFNKVKLVYNMIEAPKHIDTYINEYPHLKNKSVLGFCGGLNGHKGADLLCKVYSEFKKTNKLPTHLLIAGDGPMLTQIKNEIERLDLQNEVTLLGHISDISKFYNSIDLFLLSSRDEGMANVLFEAMSHQCKIVATRVNGVEFALNHGERGIIVESENISEMAKALDLALKTDFPLEETSKDILNLYSKEKFLVSSSELILCEEGLNFGHNGVDIVLS